MTLAPNEFYDSSELLPRVRDFLARNRETCFSEEDVSRALGISVRQAQAIYEVLIRGDEVLF